MPKALPLQPDLPLWGVQDKLPPTDGEARRVLIGDRVVPYVLRRSRRRTIGLVIDAAGLRVGAPLRAAQKDVEHLIVQHGRWILGKLDQWVGRDLRPRVRVAEGGEIPLFGAPCAIRVESGANRVRWDAGAIVLQLRGPEGAAALLEKALRQRARSLFAERLAHFAAVMDLAVPPLALSSARTRWGSCNRRTGIRLNWRLVHCSQKLIDYVVVHELAHLREMNHSPRFWAEVEAVMPDYRELRRELRSLSERLPDLS